MSETENKNGYRLEYIYLKEASGVVKGPFPLIATTDAISVKYDGYDSTTPNKFETVDAVLDFLFLQSAEKKNLFTDALIDDDIAKITESIDTINTNLATATDKLVELSTWVETDSSTQNTRLETHDSAISALEETTQNHNDRLTTLESDALDADDRAKLEALSLVDNNLQLTNSNSNIATESYVDTEIAEVTATVVAEATPLVKDAVAEELLGQGIVTEEYLQNNYVTKENASNTYITAIDAAATYSTIENVNNLTDRVLVVENKEVDLSDYYTKTQVDDQIAINTNAISTLDKSLDSTNNHLTTLKTYVDANLPEPTEANQNQILRSNGTNWVASNEIEVDLTPYLTIENAETIYATKQELEAFDALPTATSGTIAFLKWDGTEWIAEPLNIYQGETK